MLGFGVHSPTASTLTLAGSPKQTPCTRELCHHKLRAHVPCSALNRQSVQGALTQLMDSNLLSNACFTEVAATSQHYFKLKKPHEPRLPRDVWGSRYHLSIFSGYLRLSSTQGNKGHQSHMSIVSAFDFRMDISLQNIQSNYRYPHIHSPVLCSQYSADQMPKLLV